MYTGLDKHQTMLRGRGCIPFPSVAKLMFLERVRARTRTHTCHPVALEMMMHIQ
jgi:hypothetical protein